MPPDPAATLTSLLRQSTIEDHEEVLKAANASLKASKNDVHAQRTRVVALLKLDRFDDALRAIADGGSKLGDACKLEQTYALYKSGNLEEGAELARSSSERSFNHVAAQVAYRAERFDDARQIYESLSSSSTGSSGEENELAINTLATAAQRDWQSASADLPPPAENPDTFDFAFNMACGSIARGELSKALSLLQRAARLCDMADDLSDEDKLLEMGPILVQQAYVLSRLGRDDEARRIHKRLVSFDLGDAEIKLVAGNNASALHDENNNAFVTQREVETASTASGSAKLFRYQESRLRRNRLALALRAQKFPGVARETKHLLDEQPSLSSTDALALSVVNVAARSLGHSGTVALKNVLPVVEERPADVSVVLTAVQLQAVAGNLDAALTLLENLFERLDEQESLDVRFSPGLVALAVSLYRLQRRQGCIRTELAKASTFWNKQDGPQSSSLLRGAGAELLKSSNADDLAIAGATFEKLCAQASNDPVATAGLVASFAKSDPSKVAPYLSSLPSIESLVASVDARSLLQQGVVSAQVAASLSKKRAAASDARDAPQKKRRRRKLPQNFEEGKKVDPERWLPLRDRSSYRPKGKKGKKKAAENTQGGFVKEETLELAGGAGSVKVEMAPTQSSSNNKKKKKGKK